MSNREQTTVAAIISSFNWPICLQADFSSGTFSVCPFLFAQRRSTAVIQVSQLCCTTACRAVILCHSGAQQGPTQSTPYERVCVTVCEILVVVVVMVVSTA